MRLSRNDVFPNPQHEGTRHREVKTAATGDGEEEGGDYGGGAAHA
jgi:hypothetical protein